MLAEGQPCHKSSMTVSSEDLTGKVFGKLTVLKRGPLVPRGIQRCTSWSCCCACGTEKLLLTWQLTGKRAYTSCGCGARASQKTHGLSKLPEYKKEYKTWVSMRSRCLSKTDKDYAKYGGRGISICERWLKSFENFYADMGPKPSPSHSIDRIEVDGNYEPGNCRWATYTTQNRNQRRSTKIQYKGEIMPLLEVCEATGITEGSLRARLKKGESVEEAIAHARQTPNHGCKRLSISYVGKSWSVTDLAAHLGVCRSSFAKWMAQGVSVDYAVKHSGKVIPGTRLSSSGKGRSGSKSWKLKAKS